MKKIIGLFLVSVSILTAGCLKDKNYDNNRFGILPKEVRGIAFQQSRVSGALTTSTTLQTNEEATAVLNQFADSKVGVKFTVVSDPSILKSDTTLTALPSNLFTIPATLEIPAGEYSKAVRISIPDASTLDPNLKYAVGLKITSVDPGYVIASNSNTAIAVFSVKNRFDGKYKLSGRHYRVPNNFPYSDIRVDLVTTGPATVAYYNVDRTQFSNVIGVGVGTVSSYGAGIGPEFTFNLTTNMVASIKQHDPGSTALLFLAPTDPGRFDPATRTVYLQYYYTTGANQDFSNRGWSDTLTYIGPR